jgi:hypothetical protein
MRAQPQPPHTPRPRDDPPLRPHRGPTPSSTAARGRSLEPTGHSWSSSGAPGTPTPPTCSASCGPRYRGSDSLCGSTYVLGRHPARCGCRCGCPCRRMPMPMPMQQPAAPGRPGRSDRRGRWHRRRRPHARTRAESARDRRTSRTSTRPPWPPFWAGASTWIGSPATSEPSRTCSPHWPASGSTPESTPSRTTPSSPSSARSFRGILADDAVRAGLTLHHNFGPVEGSVNRIKVIKRRCTAASISTYPAPSSSRGR